MNMDSAGIVCYRSSSPEGSYNILKILYIFILEDRAYHLTGIFSACRHTFLPGLALGTDAAVWHGFPDASLPFGRGVGIVVGSGIARFCSKIICNNLCCLFAGDTRQQNFYPEILFLHHVVHFSVCLLEIDALLCYNGGGRSKASGSPFGCWVAVALLEWAAALFICFRQVRPWPLHEVFQRLTLINQFKYPFAGYIRCWLPFRLCSSLLP